MAPPQKETAAAPTKASTREERIKRPLAPPRTWKALKERAHASPAELQAELVTLVNGGAQAVFNGEQAWLLQHLLKVDPAGTLREVRDHCRDFQSDNVTLYWCLWDPEGALTALLAAKPLVGKASNGGSMGGPLSFTGMGRLAPEKGLKMILDLPPEQRSAGFFASLLGGIAADHPEQAAAYFERIVADGKIPESNLSTVLGALAAADPARATDWAEQHFGTLPDKVAHELVKGMAKTDPERAEKIYQGMMSGDADDRREPAYWISQALTDRGIDASYKWIEDNAPPGKVEELKGNAWSMWAWHHKDEAIERILKQPELLGEARGGETLGIVQSLGREADLIAVVDALPADQATKLRELLTANGLLAPDPEVDPTTSFLWLKRLGKDPAAAGEILKSMTEDQREELASTVNGDNFAAGDDPRLMLKIVGASKDGIDRKGGHKGLARLTLLDSAEAVRMVEAMPPGEARSNAVDSVWRNWKVDDSTSATAWKEKMLGGK